MGRGAYGSWGRFGSKWFPQLSIFKVPKDLATKYFDEFQVETNVLKRNDIYLVEYGANEDKAKLFTFPHSDQSETKVQAMTKPYSNLTITKLVEDGQPVNGFEVTPEIENILVKTNQLTDEQHKDIQMAIVDDSLESALSDLVDDTTQLGRWPPNRLLQNKNLRHCLRFFFLAFLENFLNALVQSSVLTYELRQFCRFHIEFGVVSVV